MPKLLGDPAVLEILGDNIARARGRRSQAEIAKSSGVDISTISDLENGQRNPSYTTLLQIAKAVGVKVEDLVREGTAKEPSEKLSALENRIAALEKALLARTPRVPAQRAKPARAKR